MEKIGVSRRTNVSVENITGNVLLATFQKIYPKNFYSLFTLANKFFAAIFTGPQLLSTCIKFMNIEVCYYNMPR